MDSPWIWLVVYYYPSKKYESIGMTIPNMWKNRKCSKPPTSHGTCSSIFFFKYGSVVLFFRKKNVVGLDGNSVVLQVQLLNSGSSNARFLMVFDVFGGLKRMGLES